MSMTEAEWQTASDWGGMLDHVRSKASTRRLLLLAVALCRRIWERFPYDECRHAVEAMERLAGHPHVDGEDYAIAAEANAALECLQEGYIRVHQADACVRGAYLAAMSCASMWHDPSEMIQDVAGAAAIAVAGDAEGPAWEAERQVQARLLHELFGNPFRPPTDVSLWLTSDIVALARAIDTNGGFDRMPTLADALQTAGCNDAEILAHCRDGGLHAHGCWVIDALLGKR
jgi:hypothetical protein